MKTHRSEKSRVEDEGNGIGRYKQVLVHMEIGMETKLRNWKAERENEWKPTTPKIIIYFQISNN